MKKLEVNKRITEDEVIDALYMNSDEKEVQRLSRYQIFELSNKLEDGYYDYETIIDAVKAYKKGEISDGYFSAWAFLYAQVIRDTYVIEEAKDVAYLQIIQWLVDLGQRVEAGEFAEDKQKKLTEFLNKIYQEDRVLKESAVADYNLAQDLCAFYTYSNYYDEEAGEYVIEDERKIDIITFNYTRQEYQIEYEQDIERLGGTDELGEKYEEIPVSIDIFNIILAGAEASEEYKKEE